MAELTLSGINKRYGGLTIVDDVSFTVNEGEFVSLLGPSGCGKSTILKMIAGLLAPSEGKILVGNRDITRLTPDKRGLGLVFQSYALFPHMSVFENVAYGLRRKREKNIDIRKTVMEALALVRMDHLADRMPGQLSGGQQQRIALARSIAPRPAVLLLDEPLSNLDAVLRDAMQIELKRLQRELNVTTIFVTHDQAEALSMSDRVCVLSGGKIQQYDVPDDVYRTPANAFVASFMGRPNELTGTIRSVSAEYGEVAIDGNTVIHAGLLNGNFGDTAKVFIRPEGITLAAPGNVTDRDSQLPAKVVLRSFAGQTIQMVLQLSGGSEIIAAVQANSPLASVAVGQDVNIAIGRDAVMVFGGE